jgi:transposase
MCAGREGGDVIAVPAGLRVLVATKPVDFRRGADSLAALVREQLRHDPFSGTIYIFRSKRADRLKILAWDGHARPDETATGPAPRRPRTVSSKPRHDPLD